MKKIHLLLTSMALLSLSVLSPSCKKNIEPTAPQAAAELSADAVIAKIPVTSVTSPADAPNRVANLIDGNTATAWSGDNKNVYPPDINSMYVVFNLGPTLQTISYIKMAFDVTTQPGIYYSFEIQVSQDGTTGWATVAAYLHNGLNNPYLQTYDFPDTRGRFVRIVGHGNNGPTPKANRWTEVEIYGSPAPYVNDIKIAYAGSQVTADNVVAPYVPANIVDGNLGTYWTGQRSGATDYKSVTVNLGAARTIDYVKLSMPTGGDPQRMTLFGIATSTDGTTWTKVITNTWSALGVYSNNKQETFDFPDVQAKYVRVTLFTHTGTYSPGTLNSLSELELYGPATPSAPYKITSVVQHDSLNYALQRTATFYYNSGGDLDSVGFAGGNIGRGAYPYRFSWNSSHQLVQSYYALDFPIGPGGEEETTNYTYQNGKIVKTMSYGDGSGGVETKLADSIVYDGQGRVIADYLASSYPSGDPDAPERVGYSEIHYSYDSHGNLIIPGVSLTYDNKISFLRSDPILMFLQRNYSQNNPVAAYAYTGYGLPLGFANGGLNHKLPFEFYGSKVLSGITYGQVY